MRYVRKARRYIHFGGTGNLWRPQKWNVLERLGVHPYWGAESFVGFRFHLQEIMGTMVLAPVRWEYGQADLDTIAEALRTFGAHMIMGPPWWPINLLNTSSLLSFYSPPPPPTHTHLKLKVWTYLYVSDLPRTQIVCP